LFLLITLLSGFFILIYKHSFIIWSEYNLNQAINCENSKVLQTKKYLASKNKTVFINKGKKLDSNLQMSDSNPISNSSTIIAHRRNRNCLAKAKANMQKIELWEKIKIKRYGTKDDYEVSTKWDSLQTLKIRAKSATSKNRNDNPQQMDL
jgi:hypothetical protein